MTRDKHYNSYQEIDRDLQIFKLQVQIDKEKIKQNTSLIKEAVSPTNIAIDIGLLLVRKVLYGRLLDKILPIGRK